MTKYSLRFIKSSPKKNKISYIFSVYVDDFDANREVI